MLLCTAYHVRRRVNLKTDIRLHTYQVDLGQLNLLFDWLEDIAQFCSNFLRLGYLLILLDVLDFLNYSLFPSVFHVKIKFFCQLLRILIVDLKELKTVLDIR